jgi:hypothetical protein
MRRIGSALMSVGLLWGLTALPARADEVYSWVDRGGTRHYGNVPTERAAPTGLDVPTSSFTTPDEEPSVDTADAPAPLDASEVEDIAARADAPEAGEEALQQMANEKQLKQIDQRLSHIDKQMDDLARARTSHAGGTPETGGLGTNAAGYLSPEEQQLDSEREQLEKQAAQLRGQE